MGLLGSYLSGKSDGSIFGDKVAKVGAKRKPQAEPIEFKHGGKVKRTGMAKVHKGERVLTKTQSRKYMRGK